AIMSKVPNYISAMKTISKYFPSLGVEDYMYTNILREQAKRAGTDFSSIAKSLKVVEHLNRVPEDREQALKQMQQWRSHGRASDMVFETKGYRPRNFLVNTWDILLERINGIKNTGRIREYVLHTLRDILAMKQFHRVIYQSNDLPDITKGNNEVVWTSLSNSYT
ncbi:MAG: hypothetical protein MUC95_02875, partial [Spirochaetes bacterium]|nr:hypothetical protein [Spirochaetota bacterium]